MSNIAVQGGAGGTGTVTLLAPSTNSNQTITLPDATGTVLTTATAGVPVNGPAFSAYRSGSNQSISINTWTKAQLNSEDFDTAGAFDSTSNYRFTPLVSGYYQINGSINTDSSSAFGTGVFAAIYKNGTLYRVSAVNNTLAPTTGIPCVSAIVYFNGSTDYVELYGFVQGGVGMLFSTSYNSTSLSGAMVRAA